VRVIAFAVLLFYGVLTLWLEQRWAWSLFQVGIFAVAACCVWQTRQFTVSPALSVLGAAAVWPLAQLWFATTSSRGITWEAAFNWFTFLVVFAMGCHILSETAARQWFLHASVLFGMVVAVIALLQQHTSHGRIFWWFASGYPDDVLGPFVNRNQYAAWVELLLPIALYQSATARANRFLPIAATATLFASVVASASRAGFVLAMVEIIATMALLFARRLAPRKALLQMCAVIAISAAIAGWQNLYQRLAAPSAESLRIDAVRASLKMIRDQPWLGFGLGTWPLIYPRYATIDTGLFLNQAHNDWLQWAAEGGVPFVLLLLVFTALLWKRAIPSIYGLGTVSFLLHAVVDYPMQQRPALAAWFFAVAALSITERKDSSPKR
jgi:O-antigen ligase